MTDSFLGRWARRKQVVQQGGTVDEKTVRSPEPAQPVLNEQTEFPPAPPAPESPPQPEAPPASMDDVQLLTRQSDFKPFVARGVEPNVRNAAMKKLFSDPHFNKIDWLDVYMDDYSIPDPLPLSMMKKMASAKFLNLFEDEQEKSTNQSSQEGALAAAPAPAETVPPQEQPLPGADANNNPKFLASAPMQAPNSTLETEHHDNTDLRLQQDHAAGAQGPGGGTQ